MDSLGNEVVEEKITLRCNLNESEMKQEGNKVVRDLFDNGRSYFQLIQDN